MTQTAEQEREWWGHPENVDGIGVWEEGTAECTAEIAPILTGLGMGSYVLDLGCGPGRVMVALAQAHPSVTFTGLDVRFYDHSGVRERNVGWMIGDGRSIPYADGTLDAVFSVALLQHLPHAAVVGYIGEIARCLKPGGKARLQHVVGTEDSFLSHQIGEYQLGDWCSEAGLIVWPADVGRVHHQWVWVTAEKPA